MSDPGPEAPRPGTGQPARGRVAAEAGALAVVATGVAALIYRLWDQAWDRPFRSAGPDVTLITSMVRAMHDHGWYLANPSLNAPFGQQFYDFPHAGETLQLALIRLLTLVVPDARVAVNVYYLLGFGLLVATTHAVLRHLRLGPWPAAAAATLYTFLPYHFWHTQDHLYRSTYLTAPLAALVLLRVLSWRTVYLRDPDGPLWGIRRLAGNLRWRTVASTALACAAIATFETMLIAFLLSSLVSCAAILAIRRRDPGMLGAAFGVVVATGAVFGLAMLPNLLYWHTHGSNGAIAKRAVVEQEINGLKPSQLVLPIPEHRIHALRALQKKATRHSPLPSEGGQELGVVGVVGLAVLLFGLLANGLRRRAREPMHDPSLLREHAGLATLVLLALSTSSGLALLLSVAGFSQVRVWNRAVVLIAFFSLLTVGLLLDRFVEGRRLLPGWKGRPLAVGVVVLVTTFGLWDAAAPRGVRYGTPANVDQLEAFTTQVEHTLPKGSSVFQLPVTDFPESASHHRMRSYDELLPYLWSHGLEWSAGGMKGRADTDWQHRVDGSAPSSSLAALRGLGFGAIEVDTYGYADSGRSVVADLTSAIGPPTVTSPGGRWVLWDLGAWARAQGLTTAEAKAAAVRLVGPALAAKVS